MTRSPATLLSLLFLVALTAFVTGGFAASSNHKVWGRIENAKKAATGLIDTGKGLSPDAYFPHDPNAAPQFYTTHDADSVTPGHLVVTRLDAASGGYQTELYDEAGNVQHIWPIDFRNLAEGGSKRTFPHGIKPLPDGSLLINFDLNRALARIDACGDPVWVRSDGVYHHEISTSEGEFWTWFGEDGRVYDGNELVQFDPETGDLLERIHLVDDIVLANDDNRRAMAITPDHAFIRDARLGSKSRDDFHPNDGTPLPASLAAAFPMFEAGDLLISLRNVNMVAVVDRATKAIKWQAQGPWIWQHDPDWHADGTITVFGNNPQRKRSQIYRVNPATGAVTAPLENGAPFFTDIMGSHQKLPSGNWLISANRTGRALEVTAEGELVREIHNIINDKFSTVVVRAEWLPAAYFTTIPACAN